MASAKSRGDHSDLIKSLPSFPKTKRGFSQGTKPVSEQGLPSNSASAGFGVAPDNMTDALARKRRVMSNTGRKVIGHYAKSPQVADGSQPNADIIQHLDPQQQAAQVHQPKIIGGR